MSDQNQIPLFSIPAAKADPTDSFGAAAIQATDSLPGVIGLGSGNSLFAAVILPLALPTTYTYGVPEIFSKVIQPGCRVEVVLGKNKKYAGIVK